MRMATKIAVIMSQSPMQKQAKCIKACKDCHDACETAIKSDENNTEKIPIVLLNLLHDCLAFTEIIPDFIKRNSEYKNSVCLLGKEICEKCIAECDKHSENSEITKVALLCRLCITSCAGI